MKARFISLLFLSATFTLSAAPTDRATLELLMADMAAVQYRNTDTALFQERLLLLLQRICNGADVNLTLPETKGNTALHYACGLGRQDIVKWLLINGANPNVRTHKGATPLDCASGYNSDAIRNLLRQYGAK